MPYRIETDDTLRRALGTDGAEWASAYISQHKHVDGDSRHHELTAWFNAAIKSGFRRAWRASLSREERNAYVTEEIECFTADAIERGPEHCRQYLDRLNIGEQGE